MHELIKEIYLYLPVKNTDDYKNKYWTTIKVLFGDLFLEKKNTKISPIKKRRLSNN